MAPPGESTTSRQGRRVAPSNLDEEILGYREEVAEVRGLAIAVSGDVAQIKQDLREEREETRQRFEVLFRHLGIDPDDRPPPHRKGIVQRLRAVEKGVAPAYRGPLPSAPETPMAIATAQPAPAQPSPSLMPRTRADWIKFVVATVIAVAGAVGALLAKP